MSKALENLRKDVEGRIAEYNELIVKKGTLSDLSRIESNLREAETLYADQQMREVFAECGKQDNPILAAVKRYSYPILSHKVNREDGQVTGIELVEDKTKQIDLVKLCKMLELPHLWEYKVEKFGNLLCMRAAKELGWSDAQVKQIENLYYCNALSKKEEMGAVPTSNTQIVKLLQTIIDAVLPLDPETGKSMYRCNSHDVAYLLMAYTKRNGKKKLTIEVSKTSFVHRLVMDVMHRVVTGAHYDLKYQMRKAKDSEPEKVDLVKALNPEAPASNGKVSEPETVSIPRPEAKTEG